MKPIGSSPWRRLGRRMLRPLAMALPRGARLLPAAVPVTTVDHRCPHGTSRNLLLVLPGIDDLPGDFARHGLAEAAWRSGFDSDVQEIDLHLGYYLRETMVERLHEDVVRTARARGYERIWLLGTSLGGLGALLYARAHPDRVDGVVLLAPFLGHDQFIDRLHQDGGAQHWHSPEVDDFQHALWNWLVCSEPKPPIYLGFGDRDRFAPAHRLLAELLPKGRVFATGGGHDWVTWAKLWNTILVRLLAQPRHWA